MAAHQTVYRCGACGRRAPRWVGRCGGCGQWNAMEEEGPPAAQGARPRPLREVGHEHHEVLATGVAELDHVLGGGLCAGSLTLVTGEPGIGKSTLALQVLARTARDGRPALVVSAEESPAEVRRRAARLGSLPDGLLISATSLVEEAEAAVVASRPAIVVVDSIHALRSRTLEGAPGGVAQVTECLERLGRLAATGAAVLIVGHVTKDGRMAGPRRLEHLVDTVLWLEGDRHGGLRSVRSTKHRHGSAGRLGILELAEDGLRSLEDPSRVLLRHRRVSPGSVVVPVVDGGRCLLVELQALVPRGRQVSGRLRTHGLDHARVAQVLATLDAASGAQLSGRPLFVSTVGGIRATEPGVDLGVAMAVASAAAGAVLPGDVTVCGEVGLTGGLRPVPGMAQRLTDARRLGFTRAVVPVGDGLGSLGGVEEVATLSEALEVVASLAGRPDALPAVPCRSGGRQRQPAADRSPHIGGARHRAP